MTDGHLTEGLPQAEEGVSMPASNLLTSLRSTMSALTMTEGLPGPRKEAPEPEVAAVEPPAAPDPAEEPTPGPDIEPVSIEPWVLEDEEDGSTGDETTNDTWDFGLGDTLNATPAPPAEDSGSKTPGAGRHKGDTGERPAKRGLFKRRSGRHTTQSKPTLPPTTLNPTVQPDTNWVVDEPESFDLPDTPVFPAEGADDFAEGFLNSLHELGYEGLAAAQGMPLPTGGTQTHEPGFKAPFSDPGVPVPVPLYTPEPTPTTGSVPVPVPLPTGPVFDPAAAPVRDDAADDFSFPQPSVPMEFVGFDPSRYLGAAVPTPIATGLDNLRSDDDVEGPSITIEALKDPQVAQQMLRELSDLC